MTRINVKLDVVEAMLFSGRQQVKRKRSARLI